MLTLPEAERRECLPEEGGYNLLTTYKWWNAESCKQLQTRTEALPEIQLVYNLKM